ncbi:hypothetical protein HHS34_010780 [Acidithiobacillus montserratensis]|uniref:Uncharacterized protein n=1 Tax=Acidithiobacillus montserratensis TaxID=2729135 RepID=A0ACD5HG91_9PROT|nr:hypothetical protein [Acidithiobacillus montserratensis]MBN2680159.1 hypothetical protein [Acidithiobacillaceae bacterium]MBU2748793.1 hypothetical protein [Acidithiobacillus montserratensis]
MDRTLRVALLKLHTQKAIPASQFTVAQRSALDRFARQTGAVTCQRQGRGDIYRVSDTQLFATHLAALSPQTEIVNMAEHLPLRAQHIAHARDSKARSHQHDCHYPLLKAVGEQVLWRQGEYGSELPLSQLTRKFGASSLCIESADTWQSQQPLWLVENQALFDRSDWLPTETRATLLYYGGQLDGRLLAWLTQRPRASRIVLFPDYDGVGLANFARLYTRLGDACEYWLMPDWQIKLARYGSPQLWQDTFREFTSAISLLPDYLGALTEQMRQSGLALEQEAVWLPSS